jgi:hypothetical protein
VYEGDAKLATEDTAVDDRPELTRRDHSILTHLQDYPRVAGCVDKCSYWGSV